MTIEKLNLHGAALSVIGQNGQSLGFVLFNSLEDHEAFANASEAYERGHDAAVPPTFSLNFEPARELSPELRREIAHHVWELADPDALPWLVAVDADLVARPPTCRELQMSEALCGALCLLVEETKSLSAAWTGEGPQVTRTLTVHTHLGDVDVTLRAPYVAVAPPRPPLDLLADFLALKRDGEEIDPDARASLEATGS